jgi:hypothetical protein
LIALANGIFAWITSGSALALRQTTAEIYQPNASLNPAKEITI